MSAEAQHAHNLGRMYLDMAAAHETLAQAVGTGLDLCAAQCRRSIATLQMRIDAERGRLYGAREDAAWQRIHGEPRAVCGTGEG